MNLIELLNWRYATKKMNGQKVSQDKIEKILEAIRLTPTSYGMQSFKAIVIENPELKKEIFEKACPQPQIAESSHIIVFASRTDLKDEEVQEYIDLIAETRKMDKSALDGFKDVMLAAKAFTPERYFAWTARQTYIALGVASVAAAELQVDSTPMEGFSNEELDKILGLKEKGYSSVSILALGYRDEANDYLANLAKVRKSMDKLVERL
jgi:nitroreductase